MDSEFGIFGGFGLIRSSILVDKQIGKGSKFDFSRFGPWFGPFQAGRVRSSGFWGGRGSNGFKVWFWWMNIKFKAVRSSFYLD